MQEMPRGELDKKIMDKRIYVLDRIKEIVDRFPYL